jgi:hypothetical protein
MQRRLHVSNTGRCPDHDAVRNRNTERRAITDPDPDREAGCDTHEVTGGDCTQAGTRW